MTAWLLVLSLSCGQSAAARKAAREIVEAFGRESLEAAEPRVARLIESHGDDAARVLRKAGAPAVPLLERFGEPGVRILGRWGDDGLRLLTVEGDSALSLIGRYGDDAVEFMIRHPGAGSDLIGHFGADVLRARIGTDSARTLNRLATSIHASGRARDVLSVVERFGDRACDFLWRNKGTLFVGAALAAFLSDPEPYLNGVKGIVVEPASLAAREAARRTDWTAVALAALAIASVALGLRWTLRASQSPHRPDRA